MDEMKLNLTTKFMRGFLAKLLSKAIKKKFGCEINIHLSEIELDMVDGRIHAHVNADVDMGSDDFKKLVKTVYRD